MPPQKIVSVKRPPPEGPSVMEPPLSRIAKQIIQAISALGGDDPSIALNPLAGPAAGLISMFPKNAAGTELRKHASTLARQQLVDLLSKTHSSADVNAAAAIFDKYPRVAAHIMNVRQVTPEFAAEFPTALGYAENHFGGNPFSTMGLNPAAIKAHGSPAAATVAHELTHVGQNLRNPEVFQKSYEIQNKLHGYPNNVYEIRARNAADRLVPPETHAELTNAFMTHGDWKDLTTGVKAGALSQIPAIVASIGRDNTPAPPPPRPQKTELAKLAEALAARMAPPVPFGGR